MSVATTKEGDTEPNEKITILAWDDKNNPWWKQPSLNQFFTRVGVSTICSSRHNTTEYNDGFATHVIEYTYNEDGYPITATVKDDDFFFFEWSYEPINP